MNSISVALRDWLIKPVMEELKKMEVLMSQLSDEIQSASSTLSDEVTALATVQTDLTTLIAKFGQPGNQFTQADLDALTALNAGLQGSVTNLKTADQAIQAALNPQPPAGQ